MKKGSENELTITIRSGPKATDPPARGLTGFNILNDKNELVSLLKHFNLLGQVTQVSKPTPGIPTLEIKLNDTLQNMVNQDIITREPHMLYNPSPQSLTSGSTALFVHVRIDPGLSPRRILIEGVKGRVDMTELKHILSYHGETLTDLQPQVWAKDGPLKDIENGDIACSIKLKIELGFIPMNNNVFKVTYPGQPMQCSNCFSWTHRAGACDRRDENRRDLMHGYQDKWKRKVNYEPMKDESDNEEDGNPAKEMNQLHTPAEEGVNTSLSDMLSNDDNNARSIFNPTSILTPIPPTRSNSKDPEEANNDHTLFNPTITTTTNQPTHTKLGTEDYPPTQDNLDEANNDHTLFNPTTTHTSNQPNQTKTNDSPLTPDKPQEPSAHRATSSKKTPGATTLMTDTPANNTNNNMDDLLTRNTFPAPTNGQEQTRNKDSSSANPNRKSDPISPKLNKNMFSTPTKIINDYEATYKEYENQKDDDEGWSITNRSKRKSDSPFSGADKTTGSGRKKSKFAEKTKAAFMVDLKKIEAAVDNKMMNIVKKEKAKKKHRHPSGILWGKDFQKPRRERSNSRRPLAGNEKGN